MGDVHVARVDVFEVRSCVSEVDLAPFNYQGQPHLPWKDKYKGLPHMSIEATFALSRTCNEACRSNTSSCNEPAMTLLPARTLDRNIGSILERGSGHTLYRHQTKASLLAIKGWVDRKHAVAPIALHLRRRQIPSE